MFFSLTFHTLHLLHASCPSNVSCFIFPCPNHDAPMSTALRTGGDHDCGTWHFDIRHRGVISWARLGTPPLAPSRLHRERLKRGWRPSARFSPTNHHPPTPLHPPLPPKVHPCPLCPSPAPISSVSAISPSYRRKTRTDHPWLPGFLLSCPLSVAASSTQIKILLAIFIPPLGVFLERGCSKSRFCH